MNVQTIAANWAAKEAFSKAMGTGIRGFGLSEVSVLRNEAGAPYFLLTGNAKILADRRGFSFSVSLSHTAELALAFVIAYDCTQG